MNNNSNGNGNGNGNLEETIRSIQNLAQKLETLTQNYLEYLGSIGAGAGGLEGRVKEEKIEEGEGLDVKDLGNVSGVSGIAEFLQITQMLCQATEALHNLRTGNTSSNTAQLLEVVACGIKTSKRERSEDEIIDNEEIIDDGNNMDIGDLQPPKKKLKTSDDDAIDATSSSSSRAPSPPTSSVNLDKKVPEKRKRGRKPIDKSGFKCVECGRTETPEWRRGPKGKNTLCNACGVAYMKLLKKERQNLERLKLPPPMPEYTHYTPPNSSTTPVSTSTTPKLEITPNPSQNQPWLNLAPSSDSNSNSISISSSRSIVNTTTTLSSSSSSTSSTSSSIITPTYQIASMPSCRALEAEETIPGYGGQNLVKTLPSFAMLEQQIAYPLPVPHISIIHYSPFNGLGAGMAQFGGVPFVGGVNENGAYMVPRN
eukprot:TRINITY_DN832_c7_g1_i1.p1 TRINITY_DN832_c7_g1~~TRINITY_DN832_c7_g1_i1.p1  ORF type:complete len:426 (-),score=155.37 TRINITY_DN832_c7_g1_i1:109-1386(-)